MAPSPVLCAGDGQAVGPCNIGQLISKKSAGAVQPGHDRADRHLQDFAGFPIRKLLDIDHQQGLSELGGEFVQGGQDVAIRHSFRNRRGRLQLSFGQVLFFAGNPFEPVPAFMANDIKENLKQPGSAIGSLLVFAERLPGDQIRLLNRIAGPALILKHPDSRSVQIIHVGEAFSLESRR